FGFHAVDQRAVTAAQVLDGNLVAAAPDYAMPPTDRRAACAEVALGAATNQEFLFLDRDLCSVLGTFRNVENDVHGAASQTVNTKPAQEGRPSQSGRRMSKSQCTQAQCDLRQGD